MNGKELKSVGDTVIILLARMPNLMRIENSRKVQTWQSLDECPWQTTNDCFFPFHPPRPGLRTTKSELAEVKSLPAQAGANTIFKEELLILPTTEDFLEYPLRRKSTNRWPAKIRMLKNGLRTSWYSLHGTIQQSSFENAVLHTYEPIPIYLDLKMRWELMDGRR